jgi:response regulator RpfG family c-di-GMP phosphodiesterase
VLIVDDEEGVRKVLAQMIHLATGAEVGEAADGQDAVLQFAQKRPDVVITDIRMPGIDGVSLLRRLKEGEAAVPVILITGYPTVDVAIQAMKDGASDFLTKPFSLEQVRVVLEKALRERRLLLDNEGLRQEVLHKRAIEKLNEELHRKVEEMRALCSLGETIASSPLNRKAILLATIDEARRATRSRHVAFLEATEQSGRLRVLVQSPNGAPAPLRSQDASPLLARALQSKAPVVERGPWRPSDPSCAGGQGDGCQMAVPILIKGQVMGLIHASGRQGDGYDQHDLLLVTELAKRAALGLENKFLYESIYDVLMSTLRSLVSTIEARDPYTRQHSQRVTDFSVCIAQELACTEEQIDTVRVAGYLHDLGKLGVKDSVLLKAGPLTDEELDQIKAHPLIGEQIIAPIGFLPDERALIRHHHERWDGKGYPDAIGGEEIPLLARIIAVADAFDAMTSDRPYRPAKSFEAGIAEILRCEGTQFDPQVVRAFRSAMPRWIVQRRSGEVGEGSGAPPPMFLAREALAPGAPEEAGRP